MNLKTGYYWMDLEGEEPEVVLINDGVLCRCGIDALWYFRDGVWTDRVQPLVGATFIGPISKCDAGALGYEQMG